MNVDFTQFYHTVLNSMQEQVYVQDLESKILYLNPSAEKLSGWSAQEALGKKCYEVFGDEHVLCPKRCPIRKETDWESKQLIQCENEFMTRTGEVKKMAINFSPLRRDDEIVGIIAVMQDITLYKQLEESLWLERNFSEKILQNLPGIFYLFSDKGKFMRWNRALEEISGYSQTEIASMPARKFFTEEDRQLISNTISEAFSKGCATMETDLLCKDGRKIPYFFTAMSFSYEGNRCVVGMGLDISERKLARQALQESEEKYRTIFQRGSQGFYLMTDVFLECNDEACRMWACERKDIIGHSPLEFSPPRQPDGSDSAAMVRKYVDAAQTGTPQQFYWQHRRKDGVLIDCEITLDQISISGKPLLLATLTDITERKRAEEERLAFEQKQQQIEKAESLSRMASAVAHNFNNMMASLIGYLEMAQEELSPQTEIGEYLTEAEMAARRAAEMSGLMLNILGHTGKDLEPIDLGRTCRDRIARLSSHAPPNVTIAIALPPSGPIVKAGDEQLSQIIDNLVTNAWEAIGDTAGKVQVAAETVPGTAIEPENRIPIEWQSTHRNYAVLSVADTGCGMNAMILSRIFDPFFSNKFTGRGLGLPVTLGIVKSLGGCITVVSKTHHGSTLRVYLPVYEESASNPMEKISPPR